MAHRTWDRRLAVMGLVQPEERRSRPTGPGDLPSDLGKPAVLLATICKSFASCHDFMGLVLPLPNQFGARFDGLFRSESRFGVPFSQFPEASARRGFEATVESLLHTICKDRD